MARLRLNLDEDLLNDGKPFADPDFELTNKTFDLLRNHVVGEIEAHSQQNVRWTQMKRP